MRRPEPHERCAWSGETGEIGHLAGGQIDDLNRRKFDGRLGRLGRRRWHCRLGNRCWCNRCCWDSSGFGRRRGLWLACGGLRGIRRWLSVGRVCRRWGAWLSLTRACCRWGAWLRLTRACRRCGGWLSVGRACGWLLLRRSGIWLRWRVRRCLDRCGGGDSGRCDCCTTVEGLR